MTPVILMRKCMAEDGEFDIAKQYFDVYEHVTDIPSGSLVIPRYSALPYFRELAYNVVRLGSKLINSYGHFSWIADFKWYWRCPDLRKITPKTWREDEFYTAPEDMEYIVKGVTNSKKEKFSTHMYANSKRQALHVGGLLYNDGAIGYQNIIYREFHKLKTFEIGINGLPFTEEFRFFVFRGQIFASGYYWSCAENTDIKLSKKGLDFAHKVADIIGATPIAYSFDIAKQESGDWLLIEINSFEMSGLSCIEPDVFYSSLNRVLNA